MSIGTTGSSTSMSSDDESSQLRVLQVGIIGAGIAGLSVAIALRKAGHEVEVFERSHFSHEIGAAISVTPNAGRILAEWGFNPTAASGSVRLRARTVDAHTLECLKINNLDENGLHYRVMSYRRADMHNELKYIAKSRRSEGIPVLITPGCEVSHVKCCTESTVFFKNRAPSKKHLIVCADGIQGPTLTNVIGHAMPAELVGRAVYRTLIPLENVEGCPEVIDTFERLGWSSFDTPFDFKETRCDIYPCRTSRTIDISIYHPAKPHENGNFDWNVPATLHDVLDTVKDLHPFFTKLVKCAKNFSCYTLRIREPASRMVRCSTALVGDAAHPMQSLHAQSVPMGIEDAATLQVFFSNFNTKDSVELRLRLWNQLRLPRVAVTVLYSNAIFYQTQHVDWVEKLRAHYKGTIPEDIRPYTQESQQFLWRYDAFEEAAKALRCKTKIGGIPDGAIEHFGLPPPTRRCIVTTLDSATET